MSTTDSPVAVLVVTAERPGSARSQDRILQTPNAVILLDGASHPDQSSETAP